MQLSAHEKQLGQLLRQLSHKFNNRYTSQASAALLRTLFHHLANHDEEYLRLFFPDGPPTSDSQPWRLTDAQGAVEGAEYTEAARGRRCGHIFRNGEATYSCRTCTADDTCVLCTRCFEASDHEGHQVYVSMSSGSSGCCDCEDPEAWVRPVKCSIHTPSHEDAGWEDGGRHRPSLLPSELQTSIRTTISRALDFLVDVLSCCPEEMRPPKSETLIRQDEEKSRLTERSYGGPDQEDKEFALLLWNDEKHTVDEVSERVARACRQTATFGRSKAAEVDEIGRSVISYSSRISELLRQAEELAQIKVTVTIRSSRDIFREQMCGTIIEWLADIVGCSVGMDHSVLMNVVCEEMLRPWRIGSEAFNLPIAKHGLVDHQKSDERLNDERMRLVQRQLMEAQATGLMQLQARRFIARQGRPPEPIAGVIEADNEAGVDDDEIDQDAVDEDDMDIDDDLGDIDIDLEGVEPAVNSPILGNARNFGMFQQLLARDRGFEDSEEDAGPAPTSEGDSATLFGDIPQTPGQLYARNAIPPAYWLERRASSNETASSHPLPPYEDLTRRIRIDHLILYDLRMWKQLRTNLKHLYISTVVAIPEFKRILSLRFVALYTHLAQLYLVADREPDHSIINLSLQMLTTPSITTEAVQRGNFLTRLLAVLYTFLTKRQVGNPQYVDLTATISFESGVLTNRRIYHFFSDMRYLLDSPFVMEKIRVEPEYLLQYLDFAKLYQGICPNIRAIGDHLEYESDAYIIASVLVRDVTRLSRQFCDAFKWTKTQDPASICRAIRQTAKVTIVNSLGIEHERFPQAELKEIIRFKHVPPYLFEIKSSPLGDQHPSHSVVDFEVEKGSMSFHHALHYALSWLIDCGKSMSRDQLQGLLTFSPQQIHSQDLGYAVQVPQHNAQEYLLALFDIPLRVCAWLTQMRAGMWVRNGITLRHQMGTYRGVAQREVSYQRDLFLLQVAFAVCDPAEFLTSIIDRFGMTNWMKGDFRVTEGFEDHQLVDVAEDFLHLLVVLLSDRTLLVPPEDDPTPHLTVAKRDIVHTLCFKPLTYSELTARLSDKIQDLPEFHEILDEVAVYRPPEGLSDSGQLQLKQIYCKEIDPYHVYYSKSQREEAEMIYRSQIANVLNQAKEDVFYVPQLREIKSGIFSDYARFSQTPLFSQIIFCFLRYVTSADTRTPGINHGRIEALLQTLLHLVLLATIEDNSQDPTNAADSFLHSLLFIRIPLDFPGNVTILWQLLMLLRDDKFDASKGRIRFLLNFIRGKKPEAFQEAVALSGMTDQWEHVLNAHWMKSPNDAVQKKKQALERQKRVMEAFRKQQNDFLENQLIDWGENNADQLDDEMPQVTVDVEPETWSFSSETCIFCQEETTEQQLFGTLAYVTESTIFRQTNLNMYSYVEEVCQVPRSLDKSAESIRPFGVAGQNIQMVTKADATGNLITSERRGLGEGFPQSANCQGPVITSCGHVMHYSCFHTYDVATSRRHQYQVHRMHPEEIKLKEFVCPLCKALGNVFLPVIWKPKPSIALKTIDDASFGGWLSTMAPSLISKSREPSETPEESALRYAGNAFVPQLASALNSAGRAATEPAVDVSPVVRANFRMPSFLRFDNHDASTDRSQMDLSARPVIVAELEKAYQRLFNTMKLNGLVATGIAPSTNAGELGSSEILAKALGNSIAAVEIAQRGVEAGSVYSYVTSVAEQTMTHLKVLSETVTSYIALGNIHNRSRFSSKSLHCARMQAQQLFGNDVGPNSTASLLITPLFSQDVFVFLAECTVYLIPSCGLDIYPILRSCYLAEIIKMVVALLLEPAVVWHSSGAKIIEEDHLINATQKHAFSSFIEDIFTRLRKASQHQEQAASGLWADANPNNRFRYERIVYHMLSKYALIFLRKSILLVHVKYGVNFSNNPTNDGSVSMDTSELLRLSRLLGLPTIDEVVDFFLSDTQGGDALRNRASAWITSYSAVTDHPRGSQEAGLTLRLAHPAIYELVSLPHAHDTLNAEAISHRCPSTGGELSDPSICLFCGQFVCCQSRCCTRENPRTGKREGGCNRHVKECGGNIGMFFNIRKCAVLCLHRDRGSFFTAPYLDKHGEVDLGLRRKNQLFLSQKRYDRLFRDMWLRHELPSAVARKLEAEINPGGWETL